MSAAPLERAFAALKAGKAQEAETIVKEALELARKENGETSSKTAAAEVDYARVVLALGNAGAAIEALKRAIAVPTPDDPTKLVRLDYQYALAEVLMRLGRLDEAKGVFEKTLEERAQLGGRNTPQYGMAEELLAETRFAAGSLEDAEKHIESSLTTLLDTKSARALSAMALRASVRQAKYGDEYPLLEHFERLAPQMQQQLAQRVLERSERDAPKIALGVLIELRERVEDSGQLDGLMPPLSAAVSNLARASGDHALGSQMLEWLVAHFDKAGNAQQALHATIALALARDEAKDVEGAFQHFEAAMVRANGLGNDALRSQVRRTHGLVASRHKRDEDAEKHLAEAIELAEKSGGGQGLARALIAQSVHRQHRDKKDEAKAGLEKAIALLPAPDPDAIHARAHLLALEQNRDCGCEEPRGPVAKALEAMVRPLAPDGLLDFIGVDPGPDLRIHLALKRKASNDEMQLMNKLLGAAVAKLRGGAPQAGGPVQGS